MTSGSPHDDAVPRRAPEAPGRGLYGGALWLFAPEGRARAQRVLDREHAPRLEMPILAEDSAAVPVRVSVEHPMEPDHYIRSALGLRGPVRAVAECARHGRLRFPLKIIRSGTLKVVFVNNAGQRWETSQPVKI